MKPATATVVTRILPPVVNEHALKDDFLSDLDLAFEEIQMGSKSRYKAKGDKTLNKDSIKVAQETFVEIAKMHLRPLSRYVKALGSGLLSKDVVEVMILITDFMMPKVKEMKLEIQSSNLAKFKKELMKIKNNRTTRLSLQDVSNLKKAFDPISVHFDLNIRGHSLAVLNVIAFYQHLCKNKKLNYRDIQRVFSIGIPSITMLRECSLQELNSLTGLDLDKITIVRNLARTFTLFELV